MIASEHHSRPLSYALEFLTEMCVTDAYTPSLHERLLSTVFSFQNEQYNQQCHTSLNHTHADCILNSSLLGVVVVVYWR